MSNHNSYWMYGVHAVKSALKNKKRKIYELILMEGHEDSEITDAASQRKIKFDIQKKKDFQTLVHLDWVHQGVIAKCEPLAGNYNLEGETFLMLDQITDPHNLGAMLRSAAAFGIDGVIVQEKNSPHETGTLAKTASGALEVVPIYRMTNLSRALEDLKKEGFWVMGLDERGDKALHQADMKGKIVFVMGAEGEGLRRLVKDTCDFLVRLPTEPEFPTLNVSVAAALTLYEWRRQKCL